MTLGLYNVLQDQKLAKITSPKHDQLQNSIFDFINVLQLHVVSFMINKEEDAEVIVDNCSKI